MLKNSQNFINNQNLINKCFEFIDLPKTEKIIEIGAGKGIMTNELIKRFDNITVFEYDIKLFNTLKEKFKNNDNIKLLNEDFLKSNLPKDKFSIISNIPFNITAEIIRKITNKASNLNKAYIIMQKDASFRFVNNIKDGETSLLSNIIQTNFEINFLLDIPSKNFSPQPKFDAGLVLFEKREKPVFLNINEEKTFLDFLCYLFDRSRPEIIRALNTIVNKKVANQLLERLKIKKNKRIKSVKFIDWVNLFKNIDFRFNTKINILIKDSYRRLLEKQAGLQKTNRTRRY